jgi:hypothetical protein
VNGVLIYVLVFTVCILFCMCMGVFVRCERVLIYVLVFTVRILFCMCMGVFVRCGCICKVWMFL